MLARVGSPTTTPVKRKLKTHNKLIARLSIFDTAFVTRQLPVAYRHALLWMDYSAEWMALSCLRQDKSAGVMIPSHQPRALGR